MSKIVRFDSFERGIVEMLEKHLAAAKEGRLRCCAVVSIEDDNDSEAHGSWARKKEARVDEVLGMVSWFQNILCTTIYDDQ